jgi:hypothetical protein
MDPNKDRAISWLASVAPICDGIVQFKRHEHFAHSDRIHLPIRGFVGPAGFRVRHDHHGRYGEAIPREFQANRSPTQDGRLCLAGGVLQVCVWCYQYLTWFSAPPILVHELKM